MKRLLLISATVLLLLPASSWGQVKTALAGQKIETFTFGPVVAGPGKAIWPATYSENIFYGLSHELRVAGYNVDIAQSSPAVVKVVFYKAGKTPGRGVFGVEWNHEVQGEAIYFWTVRSWALEKVVVGAKEKPPQFRDWTDVSPGLETTAKIKAVFSAYKQFVPSR